MGSLVPLFSPLEASNVCGQGPPGRLGGFAQKRPESELDGGDGQSIRNPTEIFSPIFFVGTQFYQVLCNPRNKTELEKKKKKKRKKKKKKKKKKKYAALRPL